MRFHGGALTLARLMLAGAIGGFLSIFTSWLITGALFHKYQRLTPDTWRPEGPTQYTLSSVVQMLGGALVGLLYFATGRPAQLLTEVRELASEARDELLHARLDVILTRH